jgi:signal transduction histidine kinase
VAVEIFGTGDDLVRLGIAAGGRRVAAIVRRGGALSSVASAVAASTSHHAPEFSLGRGGLREALVARAFETGKIAWDRIRELPIGENANDNELNASLLALPIQLRGSSLGVLLVEFPPDPVAVVPVTGALLQTAAALLVERAAVTSRAAEGSRTLERAGVVLGETLDYSTALRQAARLYIPFLGDACVLDVIGPEGAYRRVAEAHCDPEKERQLALLRTYVRERQLPTSVATIQQTMKPRIFDDLPDRILLALGVDEYEIGVIRKLGLRSVLVAPLIARDRVIGAMAFCAESRNHYREEDAAFALQLGRQAALAIDNARLYGEVSSSRERLAEILDVMPVGVQILEPLSTPPLLANRAAQWLRDDQESFDAAGRRLSHDQLPTTRAARGEAIGDFEMTVTTADGRRSLLVNSARLPSHPGVPDSVVVAFQDVTPLKQIEAQLRHSQKMEALGRLAGGISHDFNNLLTAINGYSGLGLEGMSESDPKREFFVEILHAGERAAGLTKQLLAYSRKQQLTAEVWDLRTIAADMQQILRRLIGADIRLAVHLAEVPVPALVDRGQVEQVLLNLVVNARDAMAEGGHLTIEVTNVRLAPSYSVDHPEVAPGAYAMLAVSDSGTGMAPAVKAKLFEPFFTTKEPGKGTGLGLSVVYGIVKQSGGAVSVYSEVDRGTTFRIYFPLVEVGDGLTSPPPAVRRAPNGTERILLVDDDERVRKFAAQALESQGYRVVAVGDGREALDLIKNRATPVDVVVTDVVMRDMGGQALAEATRRFRPGLPIVFMSGYTSAVLAHTGASSAFFLQKPFGPFDLATKVREALDAVG